MALSSKTKKNLKIAIFTDSFLPQVNGVVSSIMNLSKALADRGHKIIIFAPEYKSRIFEEFEYDNVIVFRVPSVPASYYEGFRWSSPFSLTYYLILKELDVDVIHFQTPITISLLGILLAKRLKKPLIGTFHTFFADPQYLKHMFPVATKAIQKFSWGYSNLFYNSADLVTTPSLSTNRELKENGCLKPIRYISNGIDQGVFDNSASSEWRDRYKLNGKTVMYLGRISQEKNITFLVDSFYLVLKEIPEAKLLIVGDGPQREELENRILRDGKEEHIIFTGSIKHDDLVVSGIFGAVEIFATASTTENQPVTILEAQANGLVCLGADARGIPYLIKDGENGLTFSVEEPESMADAVVNLFNNPDLYASMREKTTEMIKEHDMDNIASTWENTYRDIVVKRRLFPGIWRLELNKLLRDYHLLNQKRMEAIKRRKIEKSRDVL